MSHPCFKNDFDLLRHGPANRFETSPCVEIDTDASYPVTLTKRPPVPAVSGLTEHKHATRLSPAKEKGFNEIVELLPNPDRPEPNRCMMSSQKIEVGHTLKSKIRQPFCFSTRQEPVPGHRSLLFEQTRGRLCSNNICPTSIF
jgi:hypothetical protein